MSDLSLFQGANAGYLHILYDRFLQDPSSVDSDTRAYFEAHSPGLIDSLNYLSRSGADPGSNIQFSTPQQIGIDKIVGAARVTRLIRELGHLAAHVDPLGTDPPGDPGLDLSTHGITTSDLAALPSSVVGGPLAAESRDALEALGKLRRAYSGSVGYETDHVQDAEERTWLRDAIEDGQFAGGFSDQQKRDLLERLTEVETFERFLHRTFSQQKRFSIEGTDMLVPILDEIIRKSSASGVREIVLGMAHRGRLNVLAHVLGKPYGDMLLEFDHQKRDEGAAVAGRGTYGWSGDVKYHLGHSRTYQDSGVEALPITLVPNPSHLEAVNPVVEGHVRAAQEASDRGGPPRQDENAALAILIHGDAAFPGQGIVPETLNLSRLKGYHTGGTIHIIVNNQIGFTTNPSDARSTLYAGDLAKGFEIPIVHVNADDPIACIAVARMAEAYRTRFHKDFLIDLVGYRRFGHNEADEPAFTQPRMYERIRIHPTVRSIFAKNLESLGIVTRDEAEAMIESVHSRLQSARETPRVGAARDRDGSEPIRSEPAPTTGVPEANLRELNEALLVSPQGFTVNPKLDERMLQRRRTALESGKIDWAHAEALAFASILADGTPIRLSGQDSERGTFSQRHCVLNDVTSGERLVPLQRLPQARASFAVYNSPLSENAVVGFEYGFSIHAPKVLVLWEAQFGDFINGAQIIVDQFFASGQAKWRKRCSLVLLLPHGYEGQGPEHSSARIERFLQLAADENLFVVNCSTSAQYFHLLRRQASTLETDPRPLVILTPKSLLHHPTAASTLGDLSGGRFMRVLDDPQASDRRPSVTRLVLCSGKVYMDLTSQDALRLTPEVAVVRVEQLYPFPGGELDSIVQSYPALQEIVWLQEEPRNMGAWSYIAPRIAALDSWNQPVAYVGRADSASPAEGSLRRHQVEQARILAEVLASPPPVRGRSRAEARAVPATTR